MNTADLIGRYVDLRDWLEADDKAHEERQKPVRDAMQVIAGAVQLQLQESGEESVRTERGTAYLSTTLSARVKDREALFDFIRDSDEFDLLVAGVAKDALKTYMEEHQSQVPPGVEITYVTKCNFRRA